MGVRTGTIRAANRVTRVLALALVVQLGGFFPADVQAQTQVYCGFFGTCSVSTTGQDLLGLPNGTLVVSSPNAWDRLVKGSAAAAWAPLEVEARAFLAALHGVANDDRLPHAAPDEMRALVYSRLLGLADKEKKGTTLTDTERTALDAFRQAVIDRRVLAARNAVQEYYRWQAGPCTYQPPAGFGFAPYDAGPLCAVGGPTFTTPPRPPTTQEFTAYGAALANQEFVNADSQAALERMQPTLLILSGIAGAAVTSGIAALLAAAVPAVAVSFAGMIGSAVFAGAVNASLFGGLATASTGFTAAYASLGASFATLTGVGVAATLPAIIILAATVTIAGGIIIAEDAKILPALQQNLADAGKTPDIVAMAADPGQSAELLAVFVAQTLPDYPTERLNALPQPPSAPDNSDPTFDVGGSLQSVFEFRAGDGLFHQVFMHDGWFVTRTKKLLTDPAWGPWYWALSLRYVPAGNANTRVVGIQPGGFLSVDYLSATASAAKVSAVTMLNGADTVTVTWHGNHAPVLSATSNTVPTVGQPVTFTSGVSDPDGDTTEVKWFIEGTNPNWNVVSDPRSCGFTKYSTTDSQGHPIVFECPWPEYDGSTATVTFGNAGLKHVKVVARDSRLATSSQEFTVNLAPFSPTLSVVPPPTQILEGQTLTVQGDLNFPKSADGSYSALTTVIVDWGDGTHDGLKYPCFWLEADLIPFYQAALDRWINIIDPNITGSPACTLNVGADVVTYSGGPDGPWHFNLSHTYRITPGAPPVHLLRAWAYTSNHTTTTPVYGWLFDVINIRPAFTPFAVCDTACQGDYERLSGDLGFTATIAGDVTDAPTAALQVQTFWGDGTSTLLPAGCAAAGCPTASLDPTSVPGTVAWRIRTDHIYESPGTYDITTVISDGGPGGSTTTHATAHVYGLGALQGPATVSAAAPATFTYALTSPGAVTAPRPDCGLGHLAGTGVNSFTCTFDDLSAPAATTVRLQGTVNGTAYSRSLDITVMPKPVAITAFTGPLSPVEGAPAHYTVTLDASRFATLTPTPACWLNLPNPLNAQQSIPVAGTISNASTTGFDCTFPPIGPYPGVVQLDVTDSFGNGSSRRLDVTPVFRIAQDPLSVVVPTTAVYGTQFTATTRGGSGTGAVTFTASGGCSNADALVTITSGSQACSVAAAKAGDSTYQAATASPALVVTTKAQQAGLTVTTPAAASFGTSFTATATGGTTTGAVTFSASGACGNSGGASLISMTSGTGTCTVSATRAGNDNYDPVTGTSTATALRIASQVALSSSLNPAIFGQTTTLKAKVTSGVGIPGGSVTFLDGSATLGVAPLDASGQATLPATLAVGAHTITANYAGDNNRTGNTASLVQSVAKASTTTTLTSTPNPSGPRETVVFTVAVTSQFNGLVTGTVTLKRGQTTLATAPLQGGTATLPLSTLDTGTSTITALYSGDRSSAASTSNAVTQTVVEPSASTTLRLTSSRNPSLVGQAVTFTATVTSRTAGTPSGSVTFSRGRTTLQVIPLVAGRAALTTDALAAGSATIVATYSGDRVYQPSDASLTQVVNKASTVTRLTSTPNPSAVRQAVVFTVVVSTSTGAAPTGTVSILEGSTTVATAPVGAGGASTLTVSTLAKGRHNLRAVYSGDAAHAGSTTATSYAQVVQ